ncbi:outer membrane beta-barrel protein [Flammeovirga sp. SJP92]|uniref:outer membrane beta-barrel protein n=1 Tax=Flammeovirga sp. SJP92 TaxID=1775430 RepID=UPI00078796BB|nr:outer membrane beta-barrel protein [Flammeovirga sp. SJP92]KXX72167.1 hypothetical protein AVL50_00790 [Flammeovirga sp. SJP92]
MCKLKLFIFSLIILSSTSLKAQEKKLTLGLGFENNLTYSNVNEYKISGGGAGIFVNSFYHINPKTAVGVEAYLNLNYIGTDGEESDFILSSEITSYSLRGKYYLGNRKLKPFLGLGAGYYRINAKAVSPLVLVPFFGLLSSDELVAEFPTVNAFGVSPELGLSIGIFQFSTVYHFIPNVKLAEEIAVMNYNQLVFKFCFNIGILKDKE